MSEQQEPQATETPEREAPSRSRLFLEDLAGLNVDLRSAVLVPILAIVTALLVGALIILMTDIDLWRGEVTLGESLGEIGNAYKALALGSFGSIRAISETLVASAPLILGGLSGWRSASGPGSSTSGPRDRSSSEACSG